MDDHWLAVADLEQEGERVGYGSRIRLIGLCGFERADADAVAIFPGVHDFIFISRRGVPVSKYVLQNRGGRSHPRRVGWLQEAVDRANFVYLSGLRRCSRRPRV